MLLARNPRPTAIFACNDEMAAGVYKAGLPPAVFASPRTSSVVGFDDSPARLAPRGRRSRRCGCRIRDMGRLAASSCSPTPRRRRRTAPRTSIVVAAPHRPGLLPPTASALDQRTRASTRPNARFCRIDTGYQNPPGRFMTAQRSPNDPHAPQVSAPRRPSFPRRHHWGVIARELYRGCGTCRSSARTATPTLPGSRATSHSAMPPSCCSRRITTCSACSTARA